jgi:3-methyl-2-oxobutanoate hydroxymethyltransferase
MAGHETTLPITLDQMIYHAASVVRAVNRALVVVDLPFGSYQGDSKQALNSSIRIMKESGGHAVKLEGGHEVVDSIKRILTAGIPVMGHLGLTPQSIYKFGTYTVRAKEKDEAARLINDAKLLEEAGCFAIVLEKIPAALAKEVANSIEIPVIGIGAGNEVDGQVLVSHDMLGINNELVQYSNPITFAVNGYSTALPILSLVKEGDNAETSPRSNCLSQLHYRSNGSNKCLSSCEHQGHRVDYHT